MIQAALKTLLKGRTSFVIAHRLVTVVDSDLIVVMDGGLIVEMGSHQTLMARPDGLYRALCRSQFEVDEIEPTVSAPRRTHPANTSRSRTSAPRDTKQWT